MSDLKARARGLRGIAQSIAELADRAYKHSSLGDAKLSAAVGKALDRFDAAHADDGCLEERVDAVHRDLDAALTEYETRMAVTS